MISTIGILAGAIWSHSKDGVAFASEFADSNSQPHLFLTNAGLFSCAIVFAFMHGLSV